MRKPVKIKSGRKGIVGAESQQCCDPPYVTVCSEGQPETGGARVNGTLSVSLEFF